MADLTQPQTFSLYVSTQTSPSPPPGCPWFAHLSAQVLQDGSVLAVLPHLGASLLQRLPDLHLQLVVGLLQAPHRVQVGGQAVVQVLHVAPLVAHDPRPAAAARPGSRSPEASGHPAGASGHSTAHPEGRRGGDGGGAGAQAGEGGRGDAGAGAPGATISAGGAVGRRGAGEGGAA